MKIFLKTILLPIIVLILILTFITYMAIIYDISLAIALLGIFIATFFAARSLNITNKSLELSRSCTRPFLYIQNSVTTIYLDNTSIKFEFTLKNDGVLPAEINLVEIAFFRKDEQVTFDNTSTIHSLTCPSYKSNSFLFPDSSVIIAFTVYSSYPKYKEFENDFDNSRLLVRTHILYKKDNIRYETIQTMLIEKKGQNLWVLLHSIPQRWT